MVRRTTTRRYRRGTRRTRRYSRRVVRYTFSKAPVPNRMATKLRYVEYTTLDPGAAGLAAVHIVTANGCYDPNISGVGHQPRGFDQLMTFYDHYTVVSSKITVDFANPTASATNSLAIGIALKDNNTPYGNYNDYAEGRNVVSMLLPATTASSGGHVRTLSKTFSTRKFLGVASPLSNAYVRGDVASNPTEEAYFHIYCAPLGLVDSSYIRIQYRIEYNVIFTEPKQPTQS